MHITGLEKHRYETHKCWKHSHQGSYGKRSCQLHEFEEFCTDYRSVRLAIDNFQELVLLPIKVDKNLLPLTQNEVPGSCFLLSAAYAAMVSCMICTKNSLCNQTLVLQCLSQQCTICLDGLAFTKACMIADREAPTVKSRYGWQN